MAMNCKLKSTFVAEVEANRDSHCSGDGLDVTLLAEEVEEDAHSHKDRDHEDEELAGAEGISCHFHAGVECVKIAVTLSLVVLTAE